MTRIATVFGATGLQGSSVVRALLEDGTFKPRAVTRDVNSATARKFAEQGCEVVQADMGNKDSVKDAVAGAETVFVVTVPFGSVTEVVQGTNVIDASKEAGVRFLVFSTVPSISERSNGKYTHVALAEEKEQVRKYLGSSGLAGASVGTGSFLENLLGSHLGLPPFGETDGRYVWHSYGEPQMVMAFSWIDHDMGQAVVALMKQYGTHASEINGQTFVVASGRYTAQELAAELEQGLSKPVDVKFAGTNSGMQVVDEMYAFTVEYDWYPGVAIPDTRLEKLGVKFGAPADFARTVLKPHVGK
ncbi:hypothetical protein HDZ31DRAFT_36422 [Schizophyllum fasciatum]